jgi:hypothetical protein
MGHYPGWGRRKGKDSEGWRGWKYGTYIHMKPIKYPLKKEGKDGEEWEYNGRGEFVQSTLNTYMELSRWNPLVLLMYDKSKIKLKL